jgi:DNA-binding NarL/FixJ family response regulator
MPTPQDLILVVPSDNLPPEGGAPRDLGDLSRRELEVARRAAAGLALKVIAFELEISPSTAATYLVRARHKLRQASRWKLAVLLSGPLPKFTDLVPDGGWAHLAPSDIALGDLLLAGLSNGEIARQLCVNSKRAGHKVARLLSRLGLKTRNDLISVALRYLNRDHDDCGSS